MLSALVPKIKKADVETCLLTIGKKLKKKNKKKRLCLGYFGCNLQGTFQMHLEIRCFLTVSRFIVNFRSRRTLA